jgi:pimeloyl-ACP methyl ester carboxylesterase
MEFPSPNAPLALTETLLFEGQEVRYGVAGKGPPLVLVHGTPFSSVVWRRIAPHLAESRTVFLYDLLGYGRSAMQEDQDVSLGVQNRLLDALLDHWDVAAPDVVAHDFGGATALRTHLLNGRDFRTLTLIDPVALSPWGSPLVQHVRRHLEAFAGLPAYLHDALLRAYISGAVHRKLSDAEMQLYLAPWQGPRGQAGFYRQIAQMDQRYTDEVEPLYGAIRCPVSIVWGQEDQWIPVERAAQLRSRISGARLRIVPDAGHLVQEDAPEAILASVLRTIGTAS